MKNMKKSFTLVEILISMLLGSLIFYYTYSTINSTKNNHASYTKATDKLMASQDIYSHLYEDIQHSYGAVSISTGKNYDTIRFYTTNSLYNMRNPYVSYFVSKKDAALVRIESKEYFDIYSLGSSKEQKIPFMFGEVLTTNTKSFRASLEATNIVNILFDVEDGDTIVFSVYREDI